MALELTKIFARLQPYCNRRTLSFGSMLFSNAGRHRPRVSSLFRPSRTPRDTYRFSLELPPPLALLTSDREPSLAAHRTIPETKCPLYIWSATESRSPSPSDP